jgi:hypothetical protein
MGWNAEQYAGGPGVSGKPAVVMGWEDNYFDNTGDLAHGAEMYWEFTKPGNLNDFQRPLYARFLYDGAGAGGVTVFSDLGATGTLRQFLIRAGVGTPLFNVTPSAVLAYKPFIVSGAAATSATVSTTSGQALFVLNCGAGSNSSLTFQINTATAWYLQAESTTALMVRDNAGRIHAQFTQGTASTAITALSSQLTVSGAVALASTLAVTGTSTLTGATTHGSTMGVTGATTLSSSLDVAGVATFTGASLALQPASGASTLVIGSAGTAGLRFDRNGTPAQYMQCEGATTVRFRDAAGTEQIALTTGAVKFTGSIGFYGTTPIARQTLAAAATDAASTQALANDIRAKLIALGLTA